MSRCFRHLNCFQYQAVLQARVLRVACMACKKSSQVDVPWACEGSGFTQTLEAFVVALCAQVVPVLAVSRLLGVSGDRVWRVLDDCVKQARAREDYSAMRRLSADERSARRGQRCDVLRC